MQKFYSTFLLMSGLVWVAPSFATTDKWGHFERCIIAFANMSNLEDRNRSVMQVGRILLFDGKLVVVVKGRFLSNYRVSNYWEWREVLPDGSLGNKNHGYGNENRFQSTRGKSIEVKFTSGGKVDPKVIPIDWMSQGEVYQMGSQRIYVVENDQPLNFINGKYGPRIIQYRVIDQDGSMGQIIVISDGQIEGLRVQRLEDAKLFVVSY